MREALGRVCLAISSFKNDEEVLSRLEAHRDVLPLFGRVVVVDSLGTGRFEEALEARALGVPVEYRCFDENLGSAGNLAHRIRIASEGPHDFVYALNHDGDLDPSAIARLVRLSDSVDGPLGALYPLRRLTQRGGYFDVTGLRRFPFTSVRSASPPREALSEAYWSSSNGALYALAPVREGLLPFADLWMGFEDLSYGWLLHKHGYRQFVARDVQVEDGYEYRRSPIGFIADKPSWYGYYYARNLIQSARRTEQSIPVQSLALARVVLELGVTVTFRNEKRARLAATAEGILHGLTDRRGKWRKP